MKRVLTTLVDGGCWISHDRVYAFLSGRAGITEIGYHGLQPVSRNSRILVGEAGVLRFSALSGREEHPLQTNTVQWEPSSLWAETRLPAGQCELSIECSGRALLVRCEAPPGARFCVHLSKKGFFTDVHGERVWDAPELHTHAILTRCHDRITLKSWLARVGPYAGDFLIPEPLRRKIFSSAKRSGLATPDDLRDEFRDTDLAIYDAEVFLRFFGEGYTIRDAGDAWVFESPPSGAGPFAVEFSDRPGEERAHVRTPRRAAAIEELGKQHRRGVVVEGFPHLEEFAATVPRLVDSCIVRDHGVPRACPGRYYWIWAWDALVTMAEALRWGEVRGACDTARFIDGHRDEGGRIPGRWTRQLEPMDTPSAGGLEFLEAALLYEIYLETGESDLLRRLVESAVPLFQRFERSMAELGVVMGEGFYPDLLTAFGRTEQSAVCMEVGSWYVLCRILENVSRLEGELLMEERARKAAEGIAQGFTRNFWDEGRGFFRDSIDMKSGLHSALHPLFSFLFLQSPLGLNLVRPHLVEAGAFIGRELMTESGLRVLPLGESGSGGEVVLDAWYPHWDLYALKLMRRAGDGGSIVRWMRQAEKALEVLGYCPEFLAMKGFREKAPDAWLAHGSASNLNCVTSWLRALRESIAGFEFDPGGITHIPLSLPIPSVRVERAWYRGGTWTMESVFGGPYFESLTVDGTRIEGCLKIPLSAYTKGEHRAIALYGERPPSCCFTEIINASVLRSTRDGSAVEVEVNPIGHVDVAFYSPHAPRVTVDGREVPVHWDETRGCGFFDVTLQGISRFRLNNVHN